MVRAKGSPAMEQEPSPLPVAHINEIVQFYHTKVVDGQPISEVRAQSRFFRPEVRELLDRELDRLARARVKR